MRFFFLAQEKKKNTQKMIQYQSIISQRPSAGCLRRRRTGSKRLVQDSMRGRSPKKSFCKVLEKCSKTWTYNVAGRLEEWEVSIKRSIDHRNSVDPQI